MKKCSQCGTIKEDKCFKQREDGWGSYSWCLLCQRQEGRESLTKAQRRYIKKTQFFHTV